MWPSKGVLWNMAVLMKLCFRGFPKGAKFWELVLKRFLKSFQRVCKGYLMNCQNLSKGLETPWNWFNYKLLLFHQISSLSIALELLGETCYVGWPHMVEALVMAVCDGNKRYNIAWFINFIKLQYSMYLYKAFNFWREDKHFQYTISHF